MTRAHRIAIFVEEIWKWYAERKRTLPWRDLRIEDDAHRAYMILVSEVMLQQTQVSRVKIVFSKFLEHFPRIDDLANASKRDVLLAWRGMGYNRRALLLRDAARHIVEFSSRSFPTEMSELQRIPGVGPYTAAAIQNFAFNIPTPCLDTNIRRILHRTFLGSENPDGTWERSDAYLLRLAAKVLEAALDREKCSALQFSFPLDARNWHAALMDFGALVCTKRSPKWEECPPKLRGIMKASKAARGSASLSRRERGFGAPTTRIEPGRMVGQAFVPNRIFRGRIVEELRDAETGLTLGEIGRRVCIDWQPREHQEWLASLVEKLTREQLLQKSGRKFALAA